MSASQTPPRAIVGIGASAGGLESLERFFDGVSDQLDAVFIVVQHLSPNHETMMDSLLGRHTSMPVTIATDNEVLHTRRVYVLPPKQEVTIEDGRLKLHDQDRSTVPHLPIDRFFVSLAKQQATKIAAVVLSGTGSDGSKGVVAVNSAGGLVLVESEATAKFSGMPIAAVATGAAHATLPPESMPPEIERRFGKANGAGASGDAADQILTEQEQLFRILREHCQINFAHYKSSTVTRRIDRRMKITGIDSIPAYIDLLRRDEVEVDALYRDMLIGVTKFFRDPAVWEFVQSDVARRLFDNAVPEKGVRVWVPGCATGEEAYTLAIVLHEVKQAVGSPYEIKVFASDVHGDSLRHAAVGIYQIDTLSNVSQERLAKFFTRTDGGYAVSKQLRGSVVFAPHNALQDPPFTDLDMVSCRNLLIYFDNMGQKKALSLFHFGLRKNGVMLLGPSETIGSLGHEFTTLNEKCKVYMKRRNARLPSNVDVPLSLKPKTVFEYISPTTETGPQRERIRRYEAMLDHMMPPTIMVNSRRQVMESFGGAESVLRVPGGVFSNDLLDVLPVDLQAPMSALFRRAQRDQKKVRLPLTGVRVAGDEEQDVEIFVDPIPGEANEAELYLVQVTFRERAAEVDSSLAASDAAGGVVDLKTGDRELALRVRSLEDELNQTKENLQATIEELEASNEELQATNEELISSNEELQSTNEELNSVNEELHTVNVEYQSKNAELRELNEDMSQLFSSTDIGTIILDRSLSIRRFTPRIGSVFDLQPQDTGRPLASFSHTLELDNLSEITQAAIIDGEPTECEVSDKQGNKYVLKVTPYVIEETIEGVVLTLTDITSLIETRELAERHQRRLQQAIDAVPVFVSFVNCDQRYEYANSCYYKWLGLETDQVIGKLVRDVIGEETYERSRPHIEAALAGEPQVFDQSLQTRRGHIILSVTYTPAITRRGEVTGFYVSATDVTSVKKAERELKRIANEAHDANCAKSEFLAKMSHEIRSPMTSILGFADILDEQLDDPDNRNAVEIIRSNGRHLLGIINDILDLSRIESGKIELENERFELRELLTECHNAVLPHADRNGVDFEIALEPNVQGYIRGDRRRLRQVILNLLTNAIKFSPEGDVQLACKRISHSQEAFQEQFAIVIRDTGCGIPSEALESIFEPFSQVEDADKRSHEGTGLGLAITKQLVEQMGGRIEVISQLGRGSTFSVSLPWVLDDHEEPAPHDENPLEPEPRLPRLVDRRVLIIDDRRDIRFIAEHFLVDAGASVETAANGEDGLTAARAAHDKSEGFDLIVTDIQMPGMDGYATATRLRQDGYRGPVLALSASAMASDRAKALAAGCDEHLPKPIDRTKFIKIAAQLIETYSS